MSPVIVWVNSALGYLGGYLISQKLLAGWTISDWILAHVVSNFSGLFALLVTTRLESRPAIKSRFLRGSRRTWPFFVSLYFLPLLVCVPQLRNLGHLLLMTAPLAFGNGPCIVVYGPIQDWLVARAQRR